MRGVKFVMGAFLASALAIGATACGGGSVTVKAGGGTKHAKTAANKPDAKKLEADTKADDAAKVAKEKVVKTYTKIKVTETELDLDPGVSINFETGKDELTADSYDVLYEVYSYLSDNPTVNLRVEGNTDDTGDHDQNVDLSARRAARVYDFLVEGGIDAGRLDFFGCGPDNPRIADTSPEARATNRRVDFIITKDQTVLCAGVYE